MTCREIQDLIEPVAAGDEPATPQFRAHLEGCPRCAAAFAMAARVEQALSVREAPPAPPRFEAAVIGAIRRDRWRSEQQVDRAFNVALALAVALAVGGVFALMNLAGALAALGAGLTLLNDLGSRMVVAAAPALQTYLLAAAFLVTALLVWWWAERRWSM